MPDFERNQRTTSTRPGTAIGIRSSDGHEPDSRTGAGVRRQRILRAGLCIAVLTALILVSMAWLGIKGSTIKSELEATNRLAPQLKEQIISDRKAEAIATAEEIRTHTAAAREAAGDPLWTLAAAVPWIGANFSATSEIARSADDVAVLGVTPLVNVYQSLDWRKLIAGNGGTDLEPIRKAAPSVASASNAVHATVDRLNALDAGNLLPQVAGPLAQFRGQLDSIVGTLDTASNVASLAPAMLAADKPRHYLVLFQNNAEIRTTGGIPGALAVLTADKGRLTLASQTSASELGIVDPPVAVDAGQQAIYSARIGTFMQDVNLTPDFPTTASTALAMWEQKKGERLDGALSVDPVALGYLLDATGPVDLQDHQLLTSTAGKLPSQLSGQNVVKTLLSDVYAQFKDPTLQHAYFAAVAKEIFGALSSGKHDPKGILAGIGKGLEEHRILLWSGDPNEQSVVNRYPLSGAISGPSVPAAQFGVYFNDGTGAKMDYFIRRTVQLVRECKNGDYSSVRVRVTSTNTAPSDAATSLPAYVTGGGEYGVPPGTAQSNVIVYGPAQALVETATLDGTKVPFGAQRHDQRPVGTLTITLAPGQSSSVEFTFGKIVQHSQPQVVVTPTAQPMDKVVLPIESENCVAAG